VDLRKRSPGLRHFLPVVFTMLYAALIYVGDRQEQTVRVSPAHYPDDAASDEASFPAPPPLPMQLAVGINLPAVLAALPAVFVGEWLAPSSVERGSLGYVIIGMFVPLFWFGIGRRLDRRYGLLPPRQRKIRPSIFLMVPFVVLLVLDWFLLLALRGANYQGIFKLSAVIWVSLAVVALYMRLRIPTSPRFPQN